jgi:hypothetical protein
MRFLTEILAKAGITSNYVQLDTLAATPGGAPGRIVWNDVDGTLEFQMKGGNVTQQIGQELPVLVKHADNTGLTNGKVVYQFSSDGSNVTVKYASASSEATASKTFGVMTEDATGGAKGFCTTFGYVRNINTSALTEGAMIWLSETPGEMTTTRPTQPAHGVVVGRCIRQHATEGVIFVSIQNGFELDELHDVLITSKTNNDFIVYESATNLWKNKTISAVLGYTPANGANYLALTGGTLTGDLTLSGVNPRLYFTDTDNNPDYFISNTDGTFTVYDVTNSVGRFKIYSTGNAEFTNEITALSANLNGSTNAYLNLNAANAGGNEAGVYFKIGGTAKWEQYTAANDGNLSFWSNGNGIRFYITPTGGAAFASSITAGGFIYTTGNMFTGGNNTGIFLTNATNDYSWGLNRETAGLTLYAGSAAAPKVTINSGGNVIVGATGTIGFGSVKLLIKQSTNADYEGLVVQSVANSDSVTIAHTGTIGRIAVTYGSGGTGTFTDLAFATGGVDRLTIASTGASVFTSNVSATNFRVYNGSTTGGYLIPKAGWVGSGTDYAPSIAAETTYGINFFTNGSASLKMYLATTGQLQLNTYTTATSYSGTAAGYLAFDSSGNVITVAGVAATDNTKLPLTGGALTGPLTITGNGSYLGDWGYKTLELNDTSGYPGIFFRNGNNIWINRRNGADNAMDWAYSTNASAQGTGTFTHKMRLASDEWWVSTYPNYKMRVVGGDVLETLNGTSATTLYLQYHSNTGGNVNIAASKFIFYNTGHFYLGGGSDSGQSQLSSGLTSIRFPNQYSSGYTDAGVKLYIFNSGATIQGFTAGPAYDLQYHSSGSDSGRHAFYVANSEIIRFNKTSVAITGILSMATSGTSYIRMGVFPNSTSNSGEAWIGRAADRNSGTMTVQLGGGSASSRSFEVVDYAWSVVLFNVNSDGAVFANNSFRAPIFYDSNDTGYYGDFAGTSSLWGLAIRGDNGASSTANQIFFWGGGNTTTSAIGFKSNAGYFGNPTGFGDGYNTYFTMDTVGRGWVFRRGVGGSDFGAAYTSGWILNNGIWQANSEMRAPVFRFTNSSNNAYLTGNSDWGFRVVNDSGYIQFGPANGSWAHIYSGLNFYFNQNLYVNGTQVVLNSGTWGINVTGSSRGVLFSGDSAKQITDGQWAGGGSYPGYTFSGGNSRFGFSSSGGVIDVYADGNFYATDSSHLVLHAGNISGYTAGNTNSISSAVGGSYTWTGVNYFRTNQGGYCGSLDSGRMQAYSDSNNSAFLSFHKGGYYAVNMGLDADNVLRIGGWSASANRWQLDMSGNCTVAGSMYGSYFYGSGSIRCGDMWGGAGLYRPSGPMVFGTEANNWVFSSQAVTKVEISAGGIITAQGKIQGEYIYSSGWVYSSGGNTGWLQDNQNQGIRAAGYNSYFGTIATYGNNSNGYGGYTIMNNYRVILMQNSSGDFGFYNNDDWKWNLFYNRGNDCWGIGTDNTYSGDGFRCIKYGSAQYGWTTWSDRRAKENISTITGALDKVLAMRGVNFNYIIDEEKNKRVGFIAQELIEVLPEAVRYAEEIDEYNVEYGQIVSVLAEAIKEQDVKMRLQEDKIALLQAQLQTLLN